MTITRLRLTNFRQFGEKELTFEKPWTIIVAPNARGKSTIIEALYTLSNGDSPWESNHSNIIRINNVSAEQPPYVALSNAVCRVEATIDAQDTIHVIALTMKTSGQSGTKRFHIDDRPTSRRTFVSQFHSILFSPDLIDILMFEPAQRRRFIDTYAIQLSPPFSDISSQYAKVLRQRNSLLRLIAAGKQARDQTLSYWTDQLIELGTDIMMERMAVIHNINSRDSNTYPTLISYKPNIPLHALGELADRSYVHETFTQRMHALRDKELVVGITLAGPHRDDWSLVSSTRDINTYGSRGEKRMAIADIIFKFRDVLNDHIGQPPVLLLDDISSELDDDNIMGLFANKIPKDQQTIITTTHLSSLPSDIRKTSQIVKL